MLKLFRIYYQFPNWIRYFYRVATFRRSPKEKIVYLTFDDGCIPEVTPLVLEILEKYNVHATFFIVGDNARKYPDLLQEVRRQGHRIGNHTFNHLKGLKTQTADYINNVEKANELLQTNLFRPPYGRMKTSQKMAIAKHYEIILWDLLTHDYNHKMKPADIICAVKKYVRNGSIITFHDSIKAAPNMLEALPQTIEYLLSEGYQFGLL